MIVCVSISKSVGIARLVGLHLGHYSGHRTIITPSEQYGLDKQVDFRIERGNRDKHIRDIPIVYGDNIILYLLYIHGHIRRHIHGHRLYYGLNTL